MASSAQTKAFINQIGYIIQEESKSRGYKVCSAIIAQAVIESASNTSLLGYRYCNYFGMKCGSSWKGKSVNLSTKEEYTAGNLTTIKDNFRVYDSMEDGVKGYFDFISTKRYSNLKNATTAKEYLELIKKDGYATSSTYVNTNMNIVNKYDLEKFDTSLGGDVSENPYRLMNNLLKTGSKGESVKWVQWELVRHGFKVGIDGIYGNETKTAVMAFQKANNLTVDGIVGQATIKQLEL